MCGEDPLPHFCQIDSFAVTYLCDVCRREPGLHRGSCLAERDEARADREGRPMSTTYPDPRTIATEAAVKAANDAVHDAALYVADEFDRLVRLRDGRLTATLRNRLAALSAAFDVEAAAYTARDAASKAEWEALKRMADAWDRLRAAHRGSDERAPTVSEQAHRFGT